MQHLEVLVVLWSSFNVCAKRQSFVCTHALVMQKSLLGGLGTLQKHYLLSYLEHNHTMQKFGTHASSSLLSNFFV